MLLSNLFKTVNKEHKKVPIGDISFDSRKIKKKVFFSQLKEIRYQELNLLIQLC